MTVHFVVTTALPTPPALAFGLSVDIDEHLASMAASGEQAIAGVTTGGIGLGESVTWRARHFGIWFTMTSRITEWDPPRSFVDEQVHGPFARFRHEHRFEEVETGTQMVDDITFDAPMGPIGDLVERIVLGDYLRRLIEERNRHLAAAARRST